MKLLSASSEERNAVVQFDTPELIVLSNILYHATKNMSPKNVTYQLCSDLMIARDLSQHGRIDDFGLDCIMKHRQMARDNIADATAEE